MLLLKIMRIVHLAGYYHHLAILVRPNALWQLDYYSRSLTLYSWQAVPPPCHSCASERHPTTILLFKVDDVRKSVSSVISRYNGETLIALLPKLQKAGKGNLKSTNLPLLCSLRYGTVSKERLNERLEMPATFYRSSPRTMHSSTTLPLLRPKASTPPYQQRVYPYMSQKVGSSTQPVIARLYRNIYDYTSRR
jgi:hypothetical protein